MSNQDDDMQRELMGRIGVTETQNPIELLANANKQLEAGNHQDAQKIFQQVIDTTKANTLRYIDQKQHRAAAEELYIQALAYEKLEHTDERDKAYRQVVESLNEASTTAINFGENARGITYITLGGLTSLMFNDEQKAFELYTKGMEIANSKPDAGVLINLLYALGYILDGLKNTNLAAINDAQNFLSSNLKPMLSTSKLVGFSPLMNTVIDHTRRIVESRIKMPKIQIQTLVSGDLVFNEKYQLITEISNAGEGEATNLVLEISIPEGLELLDGQTSKTIEKITPDELIKHEITFRNQKADVAEETLQVTGFVSYNDMLENSRKQQFSPVDLEFRSQSKTTEFDDKLTSVSSKFPGIKDKTHETIPSIMISEIERLNKSLEDEIRHTLEGENFAMSEIGITIYDKVIKWEETLLISETDKPALSIEIDKKIADVKQQVTDEMIEKTRIEKEEAITRTRDELKSDFKREKEAMEQQFQSSKSEAVNEKETEMELKFSEERKSLVAEKESELERMAKTFENRVKQQLIEQESHIRKETTDEISKKNDEIESAIREIQADHQKEIESELENLRNDISARNQKEIDELITQHEINLKHKSDQNTETESQMADVRRLLKEKETQIFDLESKLRDLQASNEG